MSTSRFSIIPVKCLHPW